MYYEQDLVKREIYQFSRGRWLAVYGKAFSRYDKAGRPLRLNGPEDVPRLAKALEARTFYATAALYRRVESQEDVEDSKIVGYTPFFDIDTKIDKWEFAVEAAEAIISALEKEGVYKSVYALWSGEGIHVRINERALPPGEPVKTAQAVVRYVLSKTRGELEELARRSGGALKVEDLIDPKRVFTAPLSLHRELDYAAVCIPLNELRSFSPDWARPTSLKHDAGCYARYEPGEAEALAKKALAEYAPARATVAAERAPAPKAEIPRFQVMALLQAARYYVLYGDLDKAKSFGLNRAIFYAWAKHYGGGRAGARGSAVATATGEAGGGKKFVEVAGERVQIDEETGLFAMGGKPQRPADYDREVVWKIDSIYPYQRVWEAAVDYVSSFPREVLESQSRFYRRVYEPVRDSFLRDVVLGRRKSYFNQDSSWRFSTYMRT
ncbi:MAG: hypothetical protein TU35_001910 [Thermoproteus sp. AZ2]|jgi:hypothetical protein|uniref:Uncharacterized protein n=1 Tax=Thermoproteus sp. AZ2 TaxID=1609232 RepID=A0ACC6UZ74_9CREN